MAAPTDAAGAPAPEAAAAVAAAAATATAGGAVAKTAEPAGAAAAEPVKEDRGLALEMHRGFSKHMLNVLPGPYVSQDCSRMTLAYFVVGAQSLLDALPWERRPDSPPAKMERDELVKWVYTNQVLPIPSQDGDGDEPPLTHAGFRGGPYFGAPLNEEAAPEVVAEWQRAVAAHPCADAAVSALVGGGGEDAAARRQALGGLDADQSHLAMTYTALAVLRMCGDDLSRVNADAVTSAMRELQQADGSFCPVAGTENDMRFVYAACVISSILGDWRGVDCDAATRYITSAQAYDGAIGQGLGQESHGGSTYCAVAALALMGRLDALPNRRDLIRWCVQRQGLGFQGRVNKDADCCYSFWIGATLAILGKFDCVDTVNVRGYSLTCQQKTGGFGKNPTAYPDVLHTYMALSGMSLGGEPHIARIDPAYGFRIDFARACNSPANPYVVPDHPVVQQADRQGAAGDE